MKMQLKQTYLSPETETLLVQAEGAFCGGPSANAFATTLIYDYDSGTVNENGDF